MRFVVFGSLVLGYLGFGFGPFLHAQTSQPLIPLELQGDAHDTQIPAYANMATPQCDNSGTIYVRYSAQQDNSLPTRLASIEHDGTTNTINLAPAAQGDNHVFLFSAANDGSLHEIVRVPNTSDQDQPGTNVLYATFDTDGTLRSASTFDHTFIPSLLVPLPDGAFFASGVSLDDTSDGVAESAVVGVFNADAKFVARLTNPARASASKSAAQTDDETSTAFEGGVAKLGSDGDLYVLLPGDHAKVVVVSQSGRIVRDLNLQEPFESDVAHDMWISGNRILVVYEGEADSTKDAYLYVMYDAQTGEVIRVYHPEYSGTVACFQNEQTLSVLLQQPSSGKVSLGTVDLP
jgi:hypothetical protein